MKSCIGQHDSSTASPLQQHTLLTNNHWFWYVYVNTA